MSTAMGFGSVGVAAYRSTKRNPQWWQHCKYSDNARIRVIRDPMNRVRMNEKIHILESAGIEQWRIRGKLESPGVHEAIRNDQEADARHAHSVVGESCGLRPNRVLQGIRM